MIAPCATRSIEPFATCGVFMLVLNFRHRALGLTFVGSTAWLYLGCGDASPSQQNDPPSLDGGEEASDAKLTEEAAPAQDTGTEPSDGGGSDQEAGDADPGMKVCESVACSECHGSKGTFNCAPPRDTKGHTLATEEGVGAHQYHLSTGPDHPAVATRQVLCADCHPVPTLATLGQGVHMDGKIDVVFQGAPAANPVPGSPPATWNPVTHRCSNVYCHHPRTETGGFNPEPAFTNPGTASCGSCHSLPPAAPHAQVADCSHCHVKVIGPGGVWLDASQHINGTADFVDTCTACHGPTDALGRSNKPARTGH